MNIGGVPGDRIRSPACMQQRVPVTAVLPMLTDALPRLGAGRCVVARKIDGLVPA